MTLRGVDQPILATIESAGCDAEAGAGVPPRAAIGAAVGRIALRRPAGLAAPQATAADRAGADRVSR